MIYRYNKRAMKIYVFGNEDLSDDSNAIKIARTLENDTTIEFVYIKPNQDLPFEHEDSVMLMDVVPNITEPELIEFDQISKIQLPPRTSAHDFDLAFQLKYLQKLGKLHDVKIIAIPQTDKVDYLRIHSILRKLVAQDIQGS